MHITNSDIKAFLYGSCFGFVLFGTICMIIGYRCAKALGIWARHAVDSEQKIPAVLGDRMKYYEKKFEHVVKPYESFVVRLDGKNFSKHTKNLTKPFDEGFAKSMLLTAKDAFMEFHAQTGFVMSDEITLVFSATCTKEEFDNGTSRAAHPFGGRIEKLLTLMSGFVSTRFAYNFSQNVTVNNKNGPMYTFDARFFTFPQQHEYLNNIIWRSQDGYRNFVGMIARQYFTDEELHGMSTEQRVNKLKDEKVNIHVDYNNHCFYGWVIKLAKEYKDENAFRSYPLAKSFKINFSEQLSELILKKYWEDGPISCYEKPMCQKGAVNTDDGGGTEVCDFKN